MSEEDENNTKNKYKANEIGDEFHSVSIHLEFLMLKENQNAKKL